MRVAPWLDWLRNSSKTNASLGARFSTPTTCAKNAEQGKKRAILHYPLKVDRPLSSPADIAIEVHAPQLALQQQAKAVPFPDWLDEAKARAGLRHSAKRYVFGRF